MTSSLCRNRLAMRCSITVMNFMGKLYWISMQIFLLLQWKIMFKNKKSCCIEDSVFQPKKKTTTETKGAFIMYICTYKKKKKTSCTIFMFIKYISVLPLWYIFFQIFTYADLSGKTTRWNLCKVLAYLNWALKRHILVRPLGAEEMWRNNLSNQWLSSANFKESR